MTGKFQERNPIIYVIQIKLQRESCKTAVLFIPISMPQNESAIQLQSVVFDDLEVLCIFGLLVVVCTFHLRYTGFFYIPPSPWRNFPDSLYLY